MKYVVAIALLFTFGCADDSNNEAHEITKIKLDNTSNINADFELNIEDICDSVNYILLESNDSVLIGEISNIKESNNYYWIVSNQKLYQFDKTGKFINQIGNKGQGPGEYVSLYNLQVNDLTNHVYIYDYFGRKLMQYDFEGKYVGHISLPEDLSFDSFHCYNNELYLSSMANSIMPGLMVTSFDDGKYKTISSSERKMGSEGYLGTTSMYNLNDTLHLFHYFNDTIYEVRNKALHSKYILDFGKLKFNFAETDINNTTKLSGPRLQLQKCFETNAYIFVSYMLTEFENQKNKSFTAMYDKKSNTTYPHVNLIHKQHPELSLTNGAPIYYSNNSNAFLASFQYPAVEGLFDESQQQADNNPVIVKYVLK